MPDEIKPETTQQPTEFNPRYERAKKKSSFKEAWNDVKPSIGKPDSYRTVKDVSRKYFQKEQEGLVDKLTGVLNRRGLDKRIEEEISRAKREDPKRTFTILYIDLNDLREANKVSHQAGDELLITTATILQGGERLGQDIIARLGGDEFLSILRTDSVNTLSSYWDRVSKKFEEYRDDQHGIRSIRASVGVAVAGHEDLKEKIIIAEQAERLAERKIKASQLGSFTLLQTEHDLATIK